MILKGSQRASGQNLAAHLMNVADNEHLRVHELRGFTADDLRGAFKEAEAISRGTKCQQYLFSLSLSPPEGASVSTEAFEETIDRIERRLGLDEQPRAIVLHEKEGRAHAHCVWSRIDAETMTARPMAFFKNKLIAVSRELYLEHGWNMPRGLESSALRDPTNFTLAEWQQAKRQGIDPRELKAAVQDCWKRSDAQKPLERALEERGLFLARGDKRGFVVLDHQGEVYALPRLLDLKTKEVRERLGDGDKLRSVDETKQMIAQRMTPALRRHVEESKERFRERSAVLGQYKAEMTQAHRKGRIDLDERQSLQRDIETRERASMLPRGMRGLWTRITGEYQRTRREHERDAEATRLRHAAERQALIEKQREERAALQERFRELRKAEAERRLELRSEIGRFLRLSRDHQNARRERGAELSGGLALRLER